MSGELTDEQISDCDEGVLEANVKACAAHLSDLRRVHVKPLQVVQPPSYPRLRAHPGPARFPGREILATVSSGR